MAENSTLARPYAQAAFEIAKAQKALAAWGDSLELMAAVVSNEALQRMIGSPKLGREALATLIIDTCGDVLSEQGKNFVRLVVENGRVTLLPEMSAIFNELRADAEATVEAEVIAASELGEQQKKKIAAALKKKLGRDVTVTTKVDPSLIGGAIIRAGDLVIDGSVHEQLSKLAKSLMG